MSTLLGLLAASSGWSTKRVPDEIEARRSAKIEQWRAVLADITSNRSSLSMRPLDLPETVREAIEAWDMTSEGSSLSRSGRGPSGALHFPGALDVGTIK